LPGRRCAAVGRRIEAERGGFRHFLEVFDPNVPAGIDPSALGGFINDNIARTLAGVARAGRPLFLKIVYHGPKAMEELVAYDPHLVVGILGGSAGTTYDAFKLIAEAQKHGARAALFGRKINNAECQLAFVQFLRLIVDGLISPEEAVRAYHSVLAKLNIKPWRSLDDDLKLQTNVMSYASSSVSVGPIGAPSADKSGSATPPTNRCGPITSSPAEAKTSSCECGCGDKSPGTCSNGKNHGAPATTQEEAPAEPDFSRMTVAEKLAYNKAKRDRIFGTFLPPSGD
jgi:hypothetical protein